MSSVVLITYPLDFAGIAQLVERNLAKVEVASSRLVSRSKFLDKPVLGEIAKWLCSGLQIRLRRFDSDSRLHYRTMAGWQSVYAMRSAIFIQAG